MIGETRQAQKLIARKGRAGVAHWIIVPPTLADDALEAAGRAALAAKGKTFRDGDELIFQDSWAAKAPVYLMTEPLGQAREHLATFKAGT